MHAEIDPSFVEKYYNDFKDVWNVIKEDGTSLQLRINKNFYNPKITLGWPQLIELHHLPENVELYFGYYGMNLFKIQFFKEVSNSTDIPIFHSRYLNPNETKFFDVQLSAMELGQSTFVKFTKLIL